MLGAGRERVDRIGQATNVAMVDMMTAPETKKVRWTMKAGEGYLDLQLPLVAMRLNAGTDTGIITAIGRHHKMTRRRPMIGSAASWCYGTVFLSGRKVFGWR